MDLPFDEAKITQVIDRYKSYLLKIIDSKTLTFDELSKIDGRGRGLYLIFEEKELIYIGMTKNIKNRLNDLVTDFKRHSLNQILLGLELGDIIFKNTGYTFINDVIKKRLLQEEIITKQQYREFKKAVKEKIKKFNFKFYETNLINLEDLEHFSIAVLNPIYNQ